MKLWVDNINPPPKGYLWVKNAEDAVQKIAYYSNKLDWDMNVVNEIELINIIYDDKDVNNNNYLYCLIKWLCDIQQHYPIYLHNNNQDGEMKSYKCHVYQDDNEIFLIPCFITGV